MRQITFLKINGLFPIAYSHPEILASRPAYVRQLLSEAHECGYRMTLAEWIVTHATQRHLLKLTGFAELARRSLSYRLKSKFA